MYIIKSVCQILQKSTSLKKYSKFCKQKSIPKDALLGLKPIVIFYFFVVAELSCTHLNGPEI